MQNFKKFREKTGMSVSQISKRFHIPLGTVYNWEYERRQPPDYLIELLDRIIYLENLVKDSVDSKKEN